jgi:hypothetical protein
VSGRAPAVYRLQNAFPVLMLLFVAFYLPQVALGKRLQFAADLGNRKMLIVLDRQVAIRRFSLPILFLLDFVSPYCARCLLTILDATSSSRPL